MLGHNYDGKMCGSYGHISTFSFYANKHITTGEGGLYLLILLNLMKKLKVLEIYLLEK